MSDEFDNLMIELMIEELEEPETSPGSGNGYPAKKTRTRQSGRKYLMQNEGETDEEFRRKAAAIIAAV